MSISVVILNYNRPEYLKDYILPHLVTYKKVDEIIVSSGKQSTDLSDKVKHPKIKHLSHWKQENKIYGLTLRFLSALISRNKYILIMDDDILPKEYSVNFLLDRVTDNPNIIHGLYGRKLNKLNRYTVDNYFGEVPIVLTRCLITTKVKCQYFLDNFRRYETTMVKNSKPYWNGEDILFSLLSLKESEKLNHTYDLPHINRVWNYVSLREIGNSISFSDNHIKYRQRVTKEWLAKLDLKISLNGDKEVEKWKSQLGYFIQNLGFV